MGFEDYVSETEATSRAGVSPRTLQRFAEAGYLHVEIEPDGLRLYSRKELDEIFGHQAAPQPSIAEDPKIEAASKVDLIVGPKEQLTREESISSSANTDITASRLSLPPEVTPTQIAEPRIFDQTPGAFTSVEPTTGESANQFQLEQELARLRNLMKAQEALLDGRDNEVRDLKSQREWLRTRVERLEEKGERDQILLLSETQTIRRLITIQEQRKSAVKQLLEWLGVSPVVAKPMTTTEIIKSSEIANTTSPSRTSTAEDDSKSVGNG